jgi:hypothetical protein
VTQCYHRKEKRKEAHRTHMEHLVSKLSQLLAWLCTRTARTKRHDKEGISLVGTQRIGDCLRRCCSFDSFKLWSRLAQLKWSQM